MNEKFFVLSAEKQQAIPNEGYRIFPQNSYKNSPMSEIADAAGISISLPVGQSNVDMEQMEKDFSKLIQFWKSIYLRKA